MERYNTANFDNVQEYPHTPYISRN